MEEKIPYSGINLCIEPFPFDEKESLEKFVCGNAKLDQFFHEEMVIYAKHHYISPYCARNRDNREVIAIFTLANDAVVLDHIDKNDFIEESCLKISEEYISIFEK